MTFVCHLQAISDSNMQIIPQTQYKCFVVAQSLQDIHSARSCNGYPRRDEEISLESTTPVTIYGCLLSLYHMQLAVLRVFTDRTKSLLTHVEKKLKKKKEKVFLKPE